MMSDWSHEIVLAASILSWFIIGAGLAQTTIYLLQLIIAAYALSRRPPVARYMRVCRLDMALMTRVVPGRSRPFGRGLSAVMSPPRAARPTG